MLLSPSPIALTLTSLPPICSDESLLLPLFTATHPSPLEAEFNKALHNSTELLAIAPVSPPLATISPNTVHSSLLSVLHCCCSFFIPRSRFDQNLSEIIPIVLELTWNPSGSSSLVRYSYYIPHQY
jgi:hypothetical protein